jgi:hypothetical protein
MKIGVFSTFMSPLATPGMIKDFGRRAEDIGLESIWMGEHVALLDKNTFGYPSSKDGRIPVPQGGGMLDVTATFGFLAAVTSKLRFGTGVALVPQRNPIYTAKEMCTLDWLTEGRIDFGIGVGWNKEEVEACGYRWEDRGARILEPAVNFQRAEAAAERDEIARRQVQFRHDQHAIAMEQGNEFRQQLGDHVAVDRHSAHFRAESGTDRADGDGRIRRCVTRLKICRRGLIHLPFPTWPVSFPSRRGDRQHGIIVHRSIFLTRWKGPFGHRGAWRKRPPKLAAIDKIHDKPVIQSHRRRE